MTSDRERFIVAGCRPWNRRVFDDVISHFVGEWQFVATSDELAAALRSPPAPRYVFFLHWSWLVPDETVRQVECVCFHMTDLPYGRGGSPLQNLIVRGHTETHLTAFRMTGGIDEGPIYLKRPLSLVGGAEEIYMRSGELAAEMIREILSSRPEPQAQSGNPTVLRRRTPRDSEIPVDLRSLHEVFDRIRMLDAQGYPRAFLRYGRLRLAFSRATMYEGRVVADVEIELEGEE